jgi:hypothetical protein
MKCIITTLALGLFLFLPNFAKAQYEEVLPMICDSIEIGEKMLLPTSIGESYELDMQAQILQLIDSAKSTKTKVYWVRVSFLRSDGSTGSFLCKATSDENLPPNTGGKLRYYTNLTDDNGRYKLFLRLIFLPFQQQKKTNAMKAANYHRGFLLYD